METAGFDGIVREMGEISTRRSFFRLFGGAAALSAGLALGGSTLAKGKGHGKSKTHGESRAHGRSEVAAQRRGGGKKITICFNNQTRTVKKSKLGNFPGATRGACPTGPGPKPEPPAPTTRTLFLSGGPNIADPIVFDDDGSILNTTKKEFILIDNDGVATSHGARAINASLGDQLRVRVTDWGGCRSLSPLWVHVLETGEKNQIFSGYNGGRCDYPKQSDFLDFVITVAL